MSIDNDPVRRHTAAAVLRRIDDTTIASLERHAGAAPNGIGLRLAALEREWDVDRTIELEAAATGLVGIALTAFGRDRLVALPMFVGAMLLTYATTRRYPLLPVLRRLGVRSAREIAREHYALKALRGDFAGLEPLAEDVETPQPADGERRHGNLARATEAP